MRVKTCKGFQIKNADGSTMTYHGGFFYDVDTDTCNNMLSDKACNLVDESGNTVLRDDEIPPEPEPEPETVVELEPEQVSVYLPPED